MTELSINVRPEPSRVVVAVAGEIDMATAVQLKQCLLDYPSTDVLVDLSEVTFLDSAGISVLVHAHNALEARGHTFRTTRERDNVVAVLKVCGLLDLFHGDTPHA